MYGVAGQPGNKTPVAAPQIFGMLDQPHCLMQRGNAQDSRRSIRHEPLTAALTDMVFFLSRDSPRDGLCSSEYYFAMTSRRPVAER